MALARETFSVGPLGCNCSILASVGGTSAIVVDPGGDADEIAERLAARGLSVSDIVITHGHLDHILAAGRLRELTGATIGIHPDDRFLYDDVAMQGKWLGLALRNDLPEPGRDLCDGERIVAGDLALEVIAMPGHTPGSVGFKVEGEPLLVAGDTLFQRSIGRTDLPGGNPKLIERSIRERIYSLPEETIVVCGHGPETTVGEEAEENPFVTR